MSALSPFFIQYGMRVEVKSRPTATAGLVSEKATLVAACVVLAWKVLRSAVGPASVSRDSHALLLIFSKDPGVNLRARAREKVRAQIS